MAEENEILVLENSGGMRTFYREAFGSEGLLKQTVDQLLQ